MITIDLLKHHPQHIPQLSAIWHEVLGKIWVPDISMNKLIERFTEHLNDAKLPLSLIALDSAGKPVGMCSLRQNDGIRPELTPWLGSLVVDPDYQGQGIGRVLIDAVKSKAEFMGFDSLYLFTFDPTLPDYYTRLGWSKIGTDKFMEHEITVMEVGL